MATVYCTQLPHRRDGATGALVPTYNISPAHEHGTVEMLFPAQAPFQSSVPLLKQLRLLLAHYDLAKGDCLLPLGDVVICAAAAAVLAERGPFAVLKWDRNMGRYVKFDLGL